MCFGGWSATAPMPGLITEVTRSRDVVSSIRAAIFGGDEMLCGALEAHRFRDTDAVLRGKRLRIAKPHGKVTVDAITSLLVEGCGTSTRKM